MIAEASAAYTITVRAVKHRETSGSLQPLAQAEICTRIIGKAKMSGNRQKSDLRKTRVSNQNGATGFHFNLNKFKGTVRFTVVKAGWCPSACEMDLEWNYDGGPYLSALGSSPNVVAQCSLTVLPANHQNCRNNTSVAPLTFNGGIPGRKLRGEKLNCTAPPSPSQAIQKPELLQPSDALSEQPMIKPGVVDPKIQPKTR